ncbi:MAG: helix-turn-helix transcriptional regulator [Bacteroidales bacterium]
MDQPKLERLLRIMQLMTDQRNRYTIDELSELLDISQRTVYRYIDTFVSVGFIVKKSDNRVWFAKESKHFRTIADLVYFTEEEAFIIRRAVESLDLSNPVLSGVKKKLYSLYDFGRIADIQINKNLSRNVNSIMDAIAGERQIVLKDYSSSHSGNISDRVVEPIQFGVNMVDVFCYELSSNKCKTFKVHRIGEVIVTDKEWQFKENHKAILTDAFRLTGTELFPVKLKLSLAAANLLKEEYPGTEDKIERINNNEYIYTDRVCSYEGVGRFVLGLCNEIDIIDSKEFLDFLESKRKGSRF